MGYDDMNAREHQLLQVTRARGRATSVTSGIPSLDEEASHVSAAVCTGHHEGRLVVLVPAVSVQAVSQCRQQGVHITVPDGVIHQHVLPLWGRAYMER